MPAVQCTGAHVSICHASLFILPLFVHTLDQFVTPLAVSALIVVSGLIGNGVECLFSAKLVTTATQKTTTTRKAP